jgi:hypothetical protein
MPVYPGAQSITFSEAARSAGAAAEGRRRIWTEQTEIIIAKREGKVENLALVFQFSGPLRLGCGNVGISPPLGETQRLPSFSILSHTLLGHLPTKHGTTDEVSHDANTETTNPLG